MLTDYQIIARLLVAFRAGDGDKDFNVAYVDSNIIPAPWEDKDRIAMKMQTEGFVDGLKPFDTDGWGLSWMRSTPSITLKGIEYAVTNKTVQEEIQRLRKRGTELPALLANAVISLSADPKDEE